MRPVIRVRYMGGAGDEPIPRGTLISGILSVDILWRGATYHLEPVALESGGLMLTVSQGGEREPLQAWPLWFWPNVERQAESLQDVGALWVAPDKAMIIPPALEEEPHE